MTTRLSSIPLLSLLVALGTACSPTVKPTPTAAPPPAPEAPEPVRVLFIGNSLTFYNDLPGMVKHLANHSPQPLVADVGSSTIAGATLKKNWDKGDALEMIRQGGWTHVVLQGRSTEAIDNREQFFESVRLFDTEIKKAGARTVLYMTWALQKAPQGQEQISAAYHQIGDEIGACVVPVGIARQNLLARQPAAPIYTRDGKHPTPQGTYLAACLFHAMLCGQSPVGLPAEIPNPANPEQPLVSMSTEEAGVYQQVARETCLVPAGASL